jgi:putative acetyltransferase
VSVTVERVPPDAPEAADLVGRAEAELAQNYAPEHRHGLAVGALLAQRARFYLARVDGEALGCAGYVVFAPGDAELKRMFVAPGARGLGLAKRLLETIEREAASEGVARLYLETGTLQTEAIGLYRSAGFSDCGAFGDYADNGVSVFMEKRL